MTRSRITGASDDDPSGIGTYSQTGGRGGARGSCFTERADLQKGRGWPILRIGFSPGVEGVSALSAPFFWVFRMDPKSETVSLFQGLLEDEEGRLGIAHFYTAIPPSRENRENLSRYVFMMIFSPYGFESRWAEAVRQCKEPLLQVSFNLT